MALGGSGSLTESLPILPGSLITSLSSSKIKTSHPGAGLVQLPGFDSN